MPFDDPWAVDEVVTDTADVDVSGLEIPDGLLEISVPDGVLEGTPGPYSEPVTEPAELGTPPARTEVSEYTDDADMRFESASDIDCRGLDAGSGSSGCRVSLAIFPAGKRGVSRSSTALSSWLSLRLPFWLCVCCRISGAPDVTWLYADEVRDRGRGRAKGGGIEMLARSEWVVVVPGSACRPFLVECAEWKLAAEERV